MFGEYLLYLPQQVSKREMARIASLANDRFLTLCCKRNSNKIKTI